MATPLGTVPKNYTETAEERTRAFRVDCRDGVPPTVCVEREVKLVKTYAGGATETVYAPAAQAPDAGTPTGDGAAADQYTQASGGLHAYFEVSWANIATTPGSFQKGQSTVYWADLGEIVAYALDQLAARHKDTVKAAVVADAVARRQREIEAAQRLAAEAAQQAQGG